MSSHHRGGHAFDAPASSGWVLLAFQNSVLPGEGRVGERRGSKQGQTASICPPLVTEYPFTGGACVHTFCAGYLQAPVPMPVDPAELQGVVHAAAAAQSEPAPVPAAWKMPVYILLW